MAIEIIHGLQGSGKSYYAMYRIWQEIKKMHQAQIDHREYKYHVIYTNIEGVSPNKYVKRIEIPVIANMWEKELELYKKFEKRKIEQSEDFDVDFNKKIKKISSDLDQIESSRAHPDTSDMEVIDTNEDRLLKEITSHESEDDQDEFAEHLYPYMKKLGHTKCLYVLDECLMHFGTPLKGGIKRLAQYHRHYDQDYMLIGQDVYLFGKAITAMTTYNYRAVNPAMRIRKNVFTYYVYSGGWVSRTGDNKLETKSLKASETIFKLYNSGGKRLASSAFIKVILKIFVWIAVTIGFGWYVISDYGPDEPKKVNSKNFKPVKKDTPETETKKDDADKKREVRFIYAGEFFFTSDYKYEFHKDILLKSLSKGDRIASNYKNLDSTEVFIFELSDETLKKLNMEVK